MHGLQAKIRLRVFAALLVALFLVDRQIKYCIWFTYRAADAPFFNPIVNPDIAFSLPVPVLSGSLFTALLFLIVVGIIAAAVVSYRKQETAFIFWGLIAVGALSNALDRLQVGGVLDYIDFGFFPVFNVSDVLITVGVAGIVWRDLFRKRPA